MCDPPPGPPTFNEAPSTYQPDGGVGTVHVLPSSGSYLWTYVVPAGHDQPVSPVAWAGSGVELMTPTTIARATRISTRFMGLPVFIEVPLRVII